MSISEIKSNIENIEEKTKEEIIENIHELLIHIKRQESKNITLQTEIRYLTKQFKKVQEQINKILNSQVNTEIQWKRK